MRSHRRLMAWSVALFLVEPPIPAWAGMPGPTITDFARLGLETISFFLAGILASAWGLRALWNLIARDFESLPQLSYGQSLAAVLLWGLLLLLVLTTISGVRELMTPGAWERHGLPAALAARPPAPLQPSSPAPSPALEQQRIEQIERLRAELMRAAAQRDGRFPDGADASDIPSEAWELPDRLGMRYVYQPGRTIEEARVLAFEPDVYGGERYVLFADGRIERAPTGAVDRMLNAEDRP